MKTTPVTSVSSHNLFSLWEKDAQGKPGVLMNPDATVEDDERWLVVKRLHQSGPPIINSAILKPWVELTQSPEIAPKLVVIVLGQDLIAAGTHRKEGLGGVLSEKQNQLPEINPDSNININVYENAERVRADFAIYVAHHWNPWAEREKAVRETIALYSKLFTLKQFLEGSIADTALEFVWGVGIGLWNNNGTNFSYPLITIQVELKSA